MKQLTIAVPSYNMEKLLPRCLSSMADGRFQDELEVIIVDDGSTDGTAAVAERYVSQWPRLFTLVRQANGGHGAAVNTALERARGRYFRIVDADDWVHTENMRALLEALRASDADLVLDEKTEVSMATGEERYFAFPEGMPSGREVPVEALSAPDYRYFLAMHTMSVRRELLIGHHVRLLEHTFYVDMQYSIRSSAFARTALPLRLGIYFYQVGNLSQSVSHESYVRRYAEHDRVLDDCLSFLSEGEYGAEREAFVRESVALLVHTQYNIALIYNPDRPLGRRQAKALREKLRAANPLLERRTRRRYFTALLMNRLGIGDEGLRRFKRLLKQ